MNPIWAQIIAGLTGIASTVLVKILDHVLAARLRRAQTPPVAKEDRP